MADTTRNKTKQVTIDTVSWTALTPGMPCKSIAVKTDNASAFKLRTTDTDPTTEDSVPAGSQETIGAASDNIRFSATDTVWYAQAVAGTPKAIVKAVL